MSVLQCIMGADGTLSDLQASINSQLADMDLASINRVTFDYGDSKNRISVNYVSGKDVNHANDFEVLALANSKISDLASSFNQELVTEGSTSAQLCPTSIDGCYGNGKNRGIVSMEPASISGADPNLTYCVAGMTNSSISDLQASVNQFIADNSKFTFLDVSYYYGDSKNRALILYAFSG
ncbi:MAG: hypothetical protein P1U56_15485 [Saprospiraceae bacterium]|nr:hypothetical protein [Saprospiraceae bacterium]